MRIDGWKSIAAYLGRERTTVMRWSVERGMPIHRIPGERRGSVFALSEELDEWLNAGNDTAQAGDETGAPQGARTDRVGTGFATTWGNLLARKWRGLKLVYVLPAVFATITLGALAWSQPETSQALRNLPNDPQVANLYLDARGEWAERSAGSIDSAITKLREVVEREPGFAPAYAALADCYLLAREFGSLSDIEAFSRAQAAINAALRVDPANAAALRADGFLDYWWRGNRQAAKAKFERSLTLMPEVAQSHFWYGNILIDNGDFAEGLAQLDKARLLEPGSVAMQADIAWAQWSAGNETLARTSLEALRTRDPDMATIRDYLAVIYLADGDIAGFVDESIAQAAIRQEAEYSRHVERLKAARQGGDKAVLRTLLADTLGEFTKGDRTQLAWPLYVASMAGDRAEVMRLLQMADQRNERWGSAGLMREVAQRWRGDSQIKALLERRRAPSLATSAS